MIATGKDSNRSRNTMHMRTATISRKGVSLVTGSVVEIIMAGFELGG